MDSPIMGGQLEELLGVGRKALPVMAVVQEEPDRRVI
jgi:hypothetical protein